MLLGNLSAALVNCVDTASTPDYSKRTKFSAGSMRSLIKHVLCQSLLTVSVFWLWNRLGGNTELVISPPILNFLFRFRDLRRAHLRG